MPVIGQGHTSQPKLYELCGIMLTTCTGNLKEGANFFNDTSQEMTMAQKFSVLQHHVKEEMCKSCWIISYFDLSP